MTLYYVQCPECGEDTENEEIVKTVAKSDGEPEEQISNGEYCTNKECFYYENPL